SGSMNRFAPATMVARLIKQTEPQIAAALLSEGTNERARTEIQLQLMRLKERLAVAGRLAAITKGTGPCLSSNSSRRHAALYAGSKRQPACRDIELCQVRAYFRFGEDLQQALDGQHRPSARR